MKPLLFFLLTCVLSSHSLAAQRTLNNPFFCFNNALNKQEPAPLPLDKQAALLAKLGYDGMEGKETTDLLKTVAAFKQHELTVPADYLKIDLDGDPAYDPAWKSILPQLKGSNMILWVHIHSRKFKPSDQAADEVIIPILRELAALAQPSGVRVAIYPHVGFVAEKSADSARLARKAKRENIGSVFNLCHFLKTEPAENLARAIDDTLPTLFAASISGADRGDTQKMNWNRLIQPLGKGTFDVYRVVEMLAEKGFKGPIGLQCYNLKGDPEEYLAESMATWKSFGTRYAQAPNTLTPEEAADGWMLLFDGKSGAHWRGLGREDFPKTCWKIENGELISNLAGGAKPSNRVNIVTRAKYGDFILRWDWRMTTKGGNSGLKYFVQEGSGRDKGNGLEYQILDDANHEWMLEGKMKPNDYYTVGSLYEIFPASADKAPSPLGLWNESRVVSKGTLVEHWLNGRKILEYDRASPAFREKIAGSKFKNVRNFGILPEGHLLLQDHGSVVHFRNLKIKPLH